MKVRIYVIELFATGHLRLPQPQWPVAFFGYVIYGMS